MRVRDMTEMEVNGVLFVEFPSELSPEETMDLLECRIRETARRCDGKVPKSDEYEVEISPGWLWIMLQQQEEEKVDGMTPMQIERAARMALESKKRNERMSKQITVNESQN